jgi:hypothetical protein
MGASICCAEAEADTQFTIFDLSALKKQCLIFERIDSGEFLVTEIVKKGVGFIFQELSKQEVAGFL